jgi:hypothetical protein
LDAVLVPAGAVAVWVMCRVSRYRGAVVRKLRCLQSYICRNQLVVRERLPEWIGRDPHGNGTAVCVATCCPIARGYARAVGTVVG